MTYLVKKLGHQELGSITEANPRANRGRYLFIPRHPQLLSNLPHLSETIRNDFTPLTLIPLYKDSFERDYCTFVYNNDVYHGGSRNEYRIYSNQALESNEYLFCSNDIIVIKPSTLATNVDGIYQHEEIYYIYLIQDHNSVLYNNLSEEIEKSGIRGSYAVINRDIEEIESRIDEILDTRILIQDNGVNETGEGASAVVDYITNNANKSGTSLESLFTNQQMFKDFLTVGYNGLCAITREVITSGRFNNLQAAHIQPRSHGGTYNPNNGILLSRDLHWAFDIGCFTIKDDLTIEVHPNISSHALRQYDGESIFIPEIDFFRPSARNLRYHRENIYGSFLNRGSMINPDLA